MTPATKWILEFLGIVGRWAVWLWMLFAFGAIVTVIWDIEYADEEIEDENAGNELDA